jgi:hypothetical protein
MQAVVDDTAAIYVTDLLPTEERNYRARFYFDPNSVEMAEEDNLILFEGLNRDGLKVTTSSVYTYPPTGKRCVN